MYTFKTLENTSIEEIHNVFVDAFSDYQVKIDLPLWKFQRMLQRRGYVSKISMGTFDNNTLVGFVLNGFRDWNNKLTVYDTGTGVIPQYRKQGITSNMLQNIIELLQEKNIKQYLLEVIQSNTSAFELYKKQGFKITRSFACYQLQKSKYNSLVNHKVEHVDKFDAPIWEQLKTFWDVAPSWQNSIDSVNATSDTFVYSFVRFNNEIVGYGIIDKKTGDIPQIAVNKHYQRCGIASGIMSDLINRTESEKISVINVDYGSKAANDFLNKLGFEPSVDQYEMILEL